MPGKLFANGFGGGVQGDMARGDNRHAVGEIDHGIEVMGRDDLDNSIPFICLDDRPEFEGGRIIQAGERLVQEQHPGFCHERVQKAELAFLAV